MSKTAILVVPFSVRQSETDKQYYDDEKQKQMRLMLKLDGYFNRLRINCDKTRRKILRCPWGLLQWEKFDSACILRCRQQKVGVRAIIINHHHHRRDHHEFSQKTWPRDGQKFQFKRQSGDALQNVTQNKGREADKSSDRSHLRSFEMNVMAFQCFTLLLCPSGNWSSWTTFYYYKAARK